MNKVEKGYDALQRLKEMNKSLDKQDLYKQISDALNKMRIHLMHYQLEIDEHGNEGDVYYINCKMVSEDEWYEAQRFLNKFGIPYLYGQEWRNCDDNSNN